jgi:hypothetical protein
MQKQKRHNMQLLFISTTLQLHSEPFSNSFSDGEKDYSLSDQELKEYISNYPDLHINGVAYRLLNTEYYIWIRTQLCKVVALYKQGKLTLEEIQETKDNWKIIHQYAVENLDSKLIKQTLEDIAIKANSTGYNYQTPVYQANLELSTAKANANAKQSNPYTQSNRLCPSCSPILNFLSVKQVGNSIHHNCFICNDFCSSEPIESEIETPKKPIDKFASTKPYCTIEFEGDKKTMTYPSSTPIPNERSEFLAPAKPSFSRIPNEPQRGDSFREGQRDLSDISKLKWVDMLLIFEQCQNDRELRKDNFCLYLQVVALTGYRHTNKPEVPNIGSSIGLLQFLDSSREIIRKLIEGGYYSFDIDQTAPEAILAAT